MRMMRGGRVRKCLDCRGGWVGSSCLPSKRVGEVVVNVLSRKSQALIKSVSVVLRRYGAVL